MPLKTTELCRLESLEDAVAQLAKRVGAAEASLARMAELSSDLESWDPATFARFLGISRATMIRMARDAQAPFHRIGDRMRFTPEDRRAFLAKTEGLPEKP